MQNNLVEMEDFYLDNNGLMIFTQKYLLQRGECCGNGCRHCPFDYINVPAVKRHELLAARNKNFENKK
ncbi:MAG: hypothetical protein H0W12_00425 [Chitinophagaceae bacterium]|nr:hypothetical protein [Chitinophagaceae bacterium]